MLLAVGLLGALSGAPLELAWRAPPPCPTEAAVVAQVGALVGGPFEGPARLAARVQITPPGAAWRAALELRSAAGRSERRLEADSCQALGDAVALILALALDQAPALRAPVRPAPPPGRSPSPSTRLGWAVAAGLEAGSGHLPGLAVGAAVRAALQLDAIRVGLGLTAWSPESAGEEAARVRMWLVAGELAVGRAFFVGPLELRPALVLELGRLEAQGQGPALDFRAQPAALHLSLGGRVAASVNLLGPLWVRAGAALQVAASRPEVILAELGPVFRVDAVSPRVGVGLELRLD